MTPRRAQQLICLCPREWRVRYREEFQIFLEDHPLNLRAVLNIAGWAIYEHILSLGRGQVDQRQQSLTLMLYAYLAAVVAGLNFYWTVADTPLASARQSYAMLFGSWNLVALGSVIALAAVVMVAAPVGFSLVRTACAEKRGDLVWRLAVPVCAGLVILTWIAAAGVATGAHWAPTPWDVAGDWTAPATWPPLTMRWILASITLLLMMAGLIATAVSVRQVIGSSDMTSHQRLWFTSSSMLLAGSMSVVALGVLAWGWFAEQYAGVAFHARNGGFFSSTNFASWVGSLVLFVAATVMSIRGARSALHSKAA